MRALLTTVALALAAATTSGCQVHTAPITTSLRMNGTPPDARVTRRRTSRATMERPCESAR